MNVTASRRPDASGAWSECLLVAPCTGAALAETLDGGQCFRWNQLARGVWRGISGSVAAELRDEGARVVARLLAGTSRDLAAHLTADQDWLALADRLPWRSDEHLARCVAAFRGLRILRQPIGEALLGFLCSATKQVVQIKQMAELLAARFGDEIAPAIHALPTWARLAEASEAELRACKLGFRARHVAAVARFLAGRPGWLEKTAALPYCAAKARLITLAGVGEKIADCVLLFGAGRLEAFPVDVWVLRAMARRYGLDDWTPAQVAHFGRVHFGACAGLAQQFLFAWERRHAASLRLHESPPPQTPLKTKRDGLETVP